MPTIATEAHELIAVMFRQHDTGRAELSDADFLDKLRACRCIVKAARTLLRNAEKRCNGILRYDAKAGMVLASWTEADEATAERSDGKAESIVCSALATLYGPGIADRFTVEFQRDPRGAMVKLWPHGERDKGSPLWVA